MRRRTRCVVVDYANDFHVDVVPFVARLGGGYITNRHDNVFELTNPEGFNEWLDGQDRVVSRHLVEVIRLFKYLRDFKGTFSIKSVVLTTLLGGAASSARVWGDDGYYADLPTSLVHVVRDLNDYLQANPQLPVIADPSCPGENFNHRWDQDGYRNFRERLDYYTGKIQAAYDEEDRDRSLALWQDIFGSDFKAPPAQALALSAAAAPATEQFIDRDYGFPIELGPHGFRIVGRVQRRRGFRHYDLPTQGNRVLKGSSLTFRVDRCDVPEPFDLYWKIRNTGAEAEGLNQLRGEIRLDSGGRRHVEHTRYAGSHWVEAYVVRNGRVVAMDRQRVIIP